MITKTELEAAYRALLAQRRRTPSEPPTAEELGAWADGKLSAEGAARIEELLIDYPELARAAKEPMSYDGEPGDPGYLTPSERDRQWEAMQQHIRQNRPPDIIRLTRRPQHWRTLALAASVATVIAGGVAWREHEIARSSAHGPLPRALTVEILQPGPPRGDAPARRLSEEITLLSPTLDTSQLRFPEYRVDVVDLATAPPRVLTSVAGLQPRHHGFDVLVTRAALDPDHEYAIVIYGLNGSQVESLSTYPFRP
jgi:hypothetical protein